MADSANVKAIRDYEEARVNESEARGLMLISTLAFTGGLAALGIMGRKAYRRYKGIECNEIFKN